MKIVWNKVTKFSKLLAVIVFVGTFFIGFKLGMVAEATRLGVPFWSEFGPGMMHARYDDNGNQGWGMMGGWGDNSGTQTSGSAGGTTSGSNSGATSGAPIVGAGAHCGGNIKNAPVCAAGYTCQLTVSRPDTGGTCVKAQVYPY